MIAEANEIDDPMRLRPGTELLLPASSGGGRVSEKTFTTVLHVQIDGAVLPDPLAVRLIEGWVDASVNVPSAFQLTFSDKDGIAHHQVPAAEDRREGGPQPVHRTAGAATRC